MHPYQVKPNSKIKLTDWDPQDKSLCPEGKKASLKILNHYQRELKELQEILFAEQKHKILIVLQGMDTAGKDGIIRHVFHGVDQQGIHVATFGKPSTQELAHDYLWRIHAQVPQKGKIAIFNRSHYEDVLAVRVRKLMPANVWKKRYEHINAFEKMLSDEGTVILKFYLNISYEEQAERLNSRKLIPHKQWKLIPQDVEDRKLWPQFIKAYEDTIEETNTPWAPWYIIPANLKWYRNLVVGQIVSETIANLKPQFPKPQFDISKVEI